MYSVNSWYLLANPCELRVMIVKNSFCFRFFLRLRAGLRCGNGAYFSIRHVGWAANVYRMRCSISSYGVQKKSCRMLPFHWRILLVHAILVFGGGRYLISKGLKHSQFDFWFLNVPFGLFIAYNYLLCIGSQDTKCLETQSRKTYGVLLQGWTTQIPPRPFTNSFVADGNRTLDQARTADTALVPYQLRYSNANRLRDLILILICALRPLYCIWLPTLHLCICTCLATRPHFCDPQLCLFRFCCSW